MTLEAAIALPVLLMALYILMFPLKIMNAERKLLSDMESVAKTLTLEQYLEKTGEEVVSDTALGSLSGGLIDGLQAGAAKAWILGQDEMKYFDEAQFSPDTCIFYDTQEDEESDMCYMELCYEPNYPSLWFDLVPSSMSTVTNRRAWIGSEGGRGRSEYSLELDEDDDSGALGPDTEVYIANNYEVSGVYHIDPNCHYISNDLSSCDASEISELTNKGGAGYHACESCHPGSSGTVYYTPYGTAYHSDPDCKSITSYARSVTLGELDSSAHVCQYCGRSH